MKYIGLNLKPWYSTLFFNNLC